MAVSERARHELYEWLREEAGVDNADTFMALVPPTGWGDVATRQDLEALQVATRADIEASQAAMRAEFDGLRGEFDGLRGEFKVFRAEVRAELAETRADIAERMRVQMLAMVSVFVGVTGLFFTLGQILG